jgi:hypothetical protein
VGTRRWTAPRPLLGPVAVAACGASCVPRAAVAMAARGGAGQCGARSSSGGCVLFAAQRRPAVHLVPGRNDRHLRCVGAGPSAPPFPASGPAALIGAWGPSSPRPPSRRRSASATAARRSDGVGSPLAGRSAVVRFALTGDHATAPDVAAALPRAERRVHRAGGQPAQADANLGQHRDGHNPHSRTGPRW